MIFSVTMFGGVKRKDFVVLVDENIDADGWI